MEGGYENKGSIAGLSNSYTLNVKLYDTEIDNVVQTCLEMIEL